MRAACQRLRRIADGPVDENEQMSTRLKLLLISGSLRATSSNTTALLRAADVGAALFTSTLYDGIAELPAFNPDIEELGADDARFPAEARRLRAIVGTADAMLVCIPEYAHAMPGSFKNCLDWLVGGSEFPEIPFGLINVAPHSRFASDQCLETVRTMSAHIVPEACVVIDRHSTPFGANVAELHPVAAAALQSAMTALHHAVLASERRRSRA